MAATTTALPQKWEISYDQWDDNRCVPDRGEYLAEHPELATALEATWPATETDIGTTRMREILDTIEKNHPDDEDLCYEVELARDELSPHENASCECSTYEWEAIKDALASDVEELTGRWAVLGFNDEPLFDSTDLDLDTLLEAAHRGRGLRALDATWDGTSVLTIALDGTGTDITAHRLSDSAEETARRIEDETTYAEDEPNCLIHRLGEDVVEFALDLFTSSDHLSGACWLADVAQEVHRGWPMEQTQKDAALLLATDWAATPAELLVAARAIGVLSPA